MPPTLRDRVIGCLLGGALGDAWGSIYEGQSGPLDFVIPDRPFISDDTQLTLATCESILENGTVDPAEIAACFLRWFSAGRVHGIGASTLKAFRDLSMGAHWAVAGAQGEFAAGNGAAMRIAPLAFLLDPHVKLERTLICDVCHITHRNDEAYIGALAVILAIRAAISGEPPQPQGLLSRIADQLPDSAVRDRIKELLPLRVPATEVAAKFGASGYVADTVPLALYCAQDITTRPLASVLALAITCGGDTDTIASIAGQIAGAFVGVAAIDMQHIERVQDSEGVIQIANHFGDFVCHAH